MPGEYAEAVEFQSRNREAFNFYQQAHGTSPQPPQFQSRNREAFNFYETVAGYTTVYYEGFNLVIERLLISTAVDIFPSVTGSHCFNLVIERLLISTNSMQ